MLLNIHIYFIILKTYDQQFTLTTKKSLHIIFKPRLHDTTCCQTGCQTGLTTGCLYTQYNRLYNQLYNPVWQPVERTAVRSTRLSNRLWNPFDNWFDNRLDVCLHDTAGCNCSLHSCYLLVVNTTEQTLWNGDVSYCVCEEAVSLGDHRASAWEYNTISQAMVTRTQKLTAGQLNLLHGTNNVEQENVSSDSQLPQNQQDGHISQMSNFWGNGKPPPPQPFYSPFSGTTRVRQCQKRTCGLYGAREG